MNARRKIMRAACGALLFGITQAALSASPAPAPRCDRQCLTAIAERYLAAFAAKNPANAPLSPAARYTENGVELPLPDGLWRTISSMEAYRLYVTDPQRGTVGVFIKAQELGAPALVAILLRVFDGQITGIESVISRQSATVGVGAGQIQRTDQLGNAPRPQFLQTLAPSERRSREQLADIANSYFTGLENNTGDAVPAFAPDCHRLENGTQTTNRTPAAGATPGPGSFSCTEAFRLGYYREDTRLRHRRILAIDEERGLVYANVYFDHDAVLRTYKLKDGRTVNVSRTAPWTWHIHEIFQVNKEGQISQVEAILLAVPYGMGPGWDDGIRYPSPQAIKDGYREYREY